MADSKGLAEALRWYEDKTAQEAAEAESERALSEAQDKADALVKQLAEVSHLAPRERATLIRKIALAEKAVDRAFERAADLIAA